MENSQWQPVLSYKHMQRDFTPFKGVIINVTIVYGVLYMAGSPSDISLAERRLGWLLGSGWLLTPKFLALLGEGGNQNWTEGPDPPQGV